MAHFSWRAPPLAGVAGACASADPAPPTAGPGPAPGAGAATWRGGPGSTAAAAPRFVRREDVTEEILADEREIAKEQALKSGKPEAVVEFHHHAREKGAV